VGMTTRHGPRKSLGLPNSLHIQPLNFRFFNMSCQDPIGRSGG
jgi:hypothetical protein